MNKKKRFAQKLKLNRETLRNLSEAEMKEVVGGKLRATMQDATGCPCKEIVAEVPKETN